ncbi:MAG TPA: hypothetical protein VLX31_01160 [Streptosporangiaceae bacterium]|nr:hypothetical protein [Streptosporangiaceae bacterium]
MSADHSRRALLVAAASGCLVAGCKGIAALGPLPKLTADVVTLDHAIADEELMVARYRAALTALRGNRKAAAVATSLLAEHSRHLAALRSRLILPPRLATASPRPSSSPPPLPSGVASVIADLSAAEQAAATRLLGQLKHAPGPLAQLMASIGASEAGHVALLAQARLT